VTVFIQKATTYDWPVIKKIRRQVFGTELNISENEIFDSKDRLADQFLIKFNGIIIGTFRLRYESKVSKIERMAILKEYRHHGYGLASLTKIKQYCKERKSEGIVLDSIYGAKSFYEKFGFIRSGQIFSRVGIPHIRMYLNL